MKVYIIGTPEIKEFEIQKVVGLLNKQNGPLEFLASDIPNQDVIDTSILNRKDSQTLSFDEIIEISEKYRARNDIDSKSFLVTLSSLKLDFSFYTNKKWFSYFKGNNIVVRTNDWEEYSENKPYIAISHQIIENIFQTLSGYDYEEFDYYHKRAKGCINDFCENEYEIEYKLRSGSICRQCLEKAADNDIPFEILEHIQLLLDVFRNELLEVKSILNTYSMPNLIISDTGELSIGNKIIEMEYVPKTFYIFMLLNRGREISFRFLKNNHEKLSSIYRTLKNTGNDKPILSLIGKGLNESGQVISIREEEKSKKLVKDKRHEIKTELKNVLGEELSEIFKVGSTKTVMSGVVEHCSILPLDERIKVEISDQFKNMI